MSKVLLLEPYADNATRLSFLLQLAGHQCTVARTVAEAASWLRTSRFLSWGFELLLLAGMPQPALLTQLLNEIPEASRIPVVCLQRTEPASPARIPEGIVPCPPENLVQVLHKLLAHRPGEHQKS